MIYVDIIRIWTSRPSGPVLSDTTALASSLPPLVPAGAVLDVTCRTTGTYDQECSNRIKQ